MAQLPFDRNPMVLLGSYMTNLAFNMQRMIPYMQRCGDLLQRESLLTNADHRRQTCEMAIVLGSLFEELSKATGSVAHFYKNMEIGPNPGMVRIEPTSFDPIFRSLVENTGSVNPQAQRQEAPREEVKEAEEYFELFLEELADEFNPIEMMQLMKGNVKGIPNLADRLKKVVKRYLRGEVDSRENRAHLIQKVLKVLRKLISLPANLKDTVCEEFDPTMLLDDLLTEDLPALLDLVLDHRGDDQGLVDSLKAYASKTSFKWISEMQDGFVDGFDHALLYLKENIKTILTASCEPSKAKIVVIMGLDPIVKFIEASYKEEEAKVS